MVNMTTIIDDKYNEEYDDNCDENFDDGGPEESGEVHQSGQSGSGWQWQQRLLQQVLRLGGSQAGCSESVVVNVKVLVVKVNV